MKFATVEFENEKLVGVIKNEDFFPLVDLSKSLPNNMVKVIERYHELEPLIKAGVQLGRPRCKVDQVKFLSPLKPVTFRDFMGFEEHVINSAKAASIDLDSIIDIWRKMPGFYFSNANAFFGQDEEIKAHPLSKQFDIEFEVAIIIGKKGMDIKKEDAIDHIFGFSILNDWSARDIQFGEMPMSLGPAKGKDYANSLGPVIVTKDEVAEYLENKSEARYNLKTKLYRNGQLVRENNLNTIYHTFSDMIAYASRNTYIYPGDLLGSGTIGGGALLEYCGKEHFVKPGDTFTFEIEHIGKLNMKVV